MDDGIKVAILVPISCFAMIFGIFYLRAKERIAMIERGMDPRLKNKYAYNRNFALTGGLLLIGAGLGLFFADRISTGMPPGYDPTAIYFAMIALFAGMGLFVAYLIEKRNAKNEARDEAEKD